MSDPEPWLPRHREEPKKKEPLDARLQTLGEVLRDTREARGLSQEQLGLDIEVARNHIGGLERGQRRPTITTLYKLCEGLKVELGDIICEAERRDGRRPR